MSSVLQYLLQTVKTTGIQLLILFAPLLALALAMNFVSLLTQRWAVELLGFRGWLILFKAVSTPIHELGHAVFCIVFGHHIDKISLFHPAADGTLGYVEHRYNPRNPIHQVGNFFVGLGPAIFGSILITLAALLLLGNHVFSPIQTSGTGLSSVPSAMGAFLNSLGSTLAATLREIFKPEHFSQWQFYLFLYLAFAIGNSITLSPSDLRSAGWGFLFFLTFLLLLNGLMGWMGDFLMRGALWQNQGMIQIEILILLALVLNILVAVVILILLLIKRSLGRASSRLSY